MLSAEKKFDRALASMPAESAEVERGEVGGAGDADLLVRLGGATFGGGDIGAALEELRGQAGRDGRGRGVEWDDGERDGVGRLADEDGDGVLVLGALDADIGKLDDGGLELGFGLENVGLVDDAAFEAVGGDAEGFLVILDGFGEERGLSVVGAKLEVVHGELGLDGKLDVLEVGGGGLSFFFGDVDLAADAAEEVDLVAERDGKLEVRDAVVDVLRAEVRAGLRIAEAGGAGLGADGRVAGGVLDANLGARFVKTGGVVLDVLVLDAGFHFEEGKFGVVEEGPPVAAKLGVVGCGVLPVGVFLVGIDKVVGRLIGGDDGLAVFGSDLAAGEEGGGCKEDERGVRECSLAGSNFDWLAVGDGVAGVDDDLVFERDAGRNFNGGAVVGADLYGDKRDFAAADDADLGSLGAEDDGVGRKGEVVAGVGDVEVDVDVGAGEQLAIGVGDVDLDVEGAGGGVDGAGVARDDTGKGLAWELVEGEGSGAAIADQAGVGFGHGDEDAELVDRREVEKLVGAGAGVGAAGDERADICVASGDDAIKRGVDLLKTLQLLEAADAGHGGLDGGLSWRRHRPRPGRFPAWKRSSI